MLPSLTPLVTQFSSTRWFSDRCCELQFSLSELSRHVRTPSQRYNIAVWNENEMQSRMRNLDDNSFGENFHFPENCRARCALCGHMFSSIKIKSRSTAALKKSNIGRQDRIPIRHTCNSAVVKDMDGGGGGHGT